MNYYYESGGGKVWSEDLPDRSYVCIGSQYPEDRGKVMLTIWRNGTHMTPVFDKHDNHVILEDHFGLEYRKGEWVPE